MDDFFLPHCTLPKRLVFVSVKEQSVVRRVAPLGHITPSPRQAVFVFTT
jgi:hypothetical protein